MRGLKQSQEKPAKETVSSTRNGRRTTKKNNKNSSSKSSNGHSQSNSESKSISAKSSNGLTQNSLTRKTSLDNTFEVSSSDNAMFSDADENRDTIFALPKIPSKKQKDNLVNDFQDESVVVSSNSEESPSSFNNRFGRKMQPIMGSLSVHFSVSNFEILHLSCESSRSSLNISDEVLYRRRSSSSGYIGDISKTTSPSSNCSTNYLTLPPKHLNRISQVSSSSSNSNVPNSASELAMQKLIKESSKVDNISSKRIEQLKQKYKNSDLVYILLDKIDEIVTELLEEKKVINKALEQAEDVKSLAKSTKTNFTSNKRNFSDSNSESDGKYDKHRKKKLKASSPPPIDEEEIPDKLLMGKQVFAKWQNQKYYFAHIQHTLKENKVQVIYQDKKVHVLNRNCIIIDINALIGNKIFVSEEDNQKYLPGIVTSITIGNNEMFEFTVATNCGDYSVDASRIYFNETQAKAIKRTSVQSGYQFDGSNASSDFHASCSGIQVTTKPESLYGTDTEDSNQNKPDDLDVQKQCIVGCEVETNSPQNLKASMKLKNLQGKLPKRSNKYEDSILGPLNFQGDWFDDHYFLLTSSMHDQPGSDDDVDSSSESFPFTNIPFVHDRLVQQITASGGRVVKTIEDIPPVNYDKTFLISSRPCLTPKYLKCLAYGIKIVCHSWIVRCVEQQKLLPIVELPAGWSVEKCSFINSFERKSKHPFIGLRIQIAHYSDANFSKFWTEICNEVGAQVNPFKGVFDNTDVIVAEDGMRDCVISAQSCGIPVVSSSWITQSLIHGEKRDYEGHPSYDCLYEDMYSL